MNSKILSFWSLTFKIDATNGDSWLLTADCWRNIEVARSDGVWSAAKSSDARSLSIPNMDFLCISASHMTSRANDVIGLAEADWSSAINDCGVPAIWVYIALCRPYGSHTGKVRWLREAAVWRTVRSAWQVGGQADRFDAAPPGHSQMMSTGAA